MMKITATAADRIFGRSELYVWTPVRHHQAEESPRCLSSLRMALEKLDSDLSQRVPHTKPQSVLYTRTSRLCYAERHPYQ